MEGGLQRHSACMAAQGQHKVNKSEIQAQNTLMRKWQVIRKEESLGADAFAAYNAVFC
jgi:hypothetical protein